MPSAEGRHREGPCRSDKTHYRAVVDLDQATPPEPEARWAYEQARRQITTRSKIPTEAWLYNEGTLRHQKVAMEVAADPSHPATGGEARVAVTSVYHDFGLPHA